MGAIFCYRCNRPVVLIEKDGGYYCPLCGQRCGEKKKGGDAKMTGPCLCGDPYCPSCGNPAAAEYADAVDELCERLLEKDFTLEELRQFESAGNFSVDASRINKSMQVE